MKSLLFITIALLAVSTTGFASRSLDNTKEQAVAVQNPDADVTYLKCGDTSFARHHVDKHALSSLNDGKEFTISYTPNYNSTCHGQRVYFYIGEKPICSFKFGKYLGRSEDSRYTCHVKRGSNQKMIVVKRAP